MQRGLLFSPGSAANSTCALAESSGQQPAAPVAPDLGATGGGNFDRPRLAVNRFRRLYFEPVSTAPAPYRKNNILLSIFALDVLRAVIAVFCF
ncbi:MAG: hypothetical protein HC894_02575 [Microcoleus sp. SM1_3_4]|nr:hypothetical protein [Microcoleus sp. SM1_3_4]